MRAWRLESPGGPVTLKDVPTPQARAGTLVARVEARPVLSRFGGARGRGVHRTVMLPGD